MKFPTLSSAWIGKSLAQRRVMPAALAAVIAYIAWLEFRMVTDSAQAEIPAAKADTAQMAEETPVPILIDQLPFSIKKEGHYILARSLSYSETSGPAVSVEADNVTIDLRGFTLSCTAKESDRTAVGIFARRQRRLTVVNGGIDGFYMGVQIEDVSRDAKYAPEYDGHRLRDLQLNSCTFRGIRVEGIGCDIERCTVMNTQGSTVLKPGEFYVFGIEAIGPGMRISHCRVFETISPEHPKSEAVAIGLTDGGIGSIVVDNVVSNSTRPVLGRTFGVWAVGRLEVKGNTIVNFTYPIGGDGGLWRDNALVDCVHQGPLSYFGDDGKTPLVLWTESGNEVFPKPK